LREGARAQEFSLSIRHPPLSFSPVSRLAPGAFARVNGQSAVVAQPAAGAADEASLRALLSCPT